MPIPKKRSSLDNQSFALSGAVVVMGQGPAYCLKKACVVSREYLHNKLQKLSKDDHIICLDHMHCMYDSNKAQGLSR